MRFRKADVFYWIAFLSVNFFFFLPVYFLNVAESSFFPSTKLPLDESMGWIFHLFARDNQDVFRLSADWVLIATILLILRKWRYQKFIFGLSFIAFISLLPNLSEFINKNLWRDSQFWKRLGVDSRGTSDFPGSIFTR